MADMKLGSATSSDLTNAIEDYSVPAQNTDGVSNQKETQWINPNWQQFFGYYKKIPELKKAIDMKAIWTCGNSYKATPDVQVILDHIQGWGTDTFISILKNMIITMQINGDAFAEIIRADDKDHTLLNLKPLDPGSIRIITNQKGIIIRYEQINKIDKSGIAIRIFEPSEIFHLSNDRVADEIHGVSIIEACENVILARNEAFTYQQKIVKHWAKPMLHFQLDTDDDSEIDEFVAKMDKITNKGENLYTPKDTVSSVNVIAVPGGSTLPIQSWIQYCTTFFYQAVGIPAILFGSAQEFTESTAKIAYLGFEQQVSSWQYDVEHQIWNQLALKVELEFPASLKNELISDNQKDKQQGAAQANDTNAGSGQ